MKLFDWIKEKLGFEDEEEYEYKDLLADGMSFDDNSFPMTEVLNKSAIKREQINVLDYKERELFVRERCEQMVSFSKEVEEQKIEYQIITEHMSDIEEISSLPSKDLNNLVRKAQEIIDIENAERDYQRPASKITDKQYREIERIENDIPEILRKLKESEDYQILVKRDLNLLEGEKGALAYQMKEQRNKAGNAKTLCIIIAFIAVMTIFLLMFLKVSMRMDVRIGFLILAGVVAASLTAVFVSYTNAEENTRKAEKKLNRAISIQNKTKVKYVNATNLLDYYYSKYKVDNSYELRYMWDKYIEEKNARNHSEEVAKKLEKVRKELLAALKVMRIREPSLFVYQPSLLIEEDEMAELRQSLVIRRQKLRKGIDYNTSNMEQARKDIEMLVRDYPEYAREILGIVDQYE